MLGPCGLAQPKSGRFATSLRKTKVSKKTKEASEKLDIFLQKNQKYQKNQSFWTLQADGWPPTLVIVAQTFVFFVFFVFLKEKLKFLRGLFVFFGKFGKLKEIIKFPSSELSLV